MFLTTPVPGALLWFPFGHWPVVAGSVDVLLVETLVAALTHDKAPVADIPDVAASVGVLIAVVLGLADCA